MAVFDVYPLPKDVRWDDLDETIPNSFFEGAPESLRQKMLREVQRHKALGRRFKFYSFTPTDPSDFMRDSEVKSFVRARAYEGYQAMGVNPSHMPEIRHVCVFENVPESEWVKPENEESPADEEQFTFDEVAALLKGLGLDDPDADPQKDFETFMRGVRMGQKSRRESEADEAEWMKFVTGNAYQPNSDSDPETGEPPLEEGFTRFYRADGYPDWVVEELRQQGKDASKFRAVDVMTTDTNGLLDYLRRTEERSGNKEVNIPPGFMDEYPEEWRRRFWHELRKKGHLELEDVARIVAELRMERVITEVEEPHQKAESRGLTEEKLTNAFVTAFDSFLGRPEIKLILLALQAMGSIITAVKWLFVEVISPIAKVLFALLTFVNVFAIVIAWYLGLRDWWLLGTVGAMFGWGIEAVANYIFGLRHGHNIKFMTTPNSGFFFLDPTFLNQLNLRGYLVHGIWHRDRLNRWYKRHEATFDMIGNVIFTILLVVVGVIFSFGWVFMFAGWLQGLPMWAWVSLSVLGWVPLGVTNYLFGLATGLKIQTMGGFIRNLIGMEVDLSADNPLYDRPVWLNFLPFNYYARVGMRHRYCIHWMWMTVVDNEFRARVANLPFDYPRPVRWVARACFWFVTTWYNFTEDNKEAMKAIAKPEYQNKVLTARSGFGFTYARQVVWAARLGYFLRVTFPAMAKAMINHDGWRTDILSHRDWHEPLYIRCAVIGLWIENALRNLMHLAFRLRLERFWWVLTTSEENRRAAIHRPHIWPDAIAIPIYYLVKLVISILGWLWSTAKSLAEWLADEWQDIVKDGDHHGADD